MTGRVQNYLVLLLITAGILNQADRQVIALLKPVMEVDLHWTDADYGTLAAAFQFAAAAAFPFAGWFVDRVHPKYANAIAVGTWSIAAALHGLTTTFAQFLGARIFLGASEALGTPIAVKTLSVLFDDARQRSNYFGLMGGVGCIGAILIPVSVPLLAVWYGWRWTFIVAGATGILWAGLWYAMAKLAEWRWHGTQDSDASWRSIFRDSRTWTISAAKVLSDQAWWMLLYWVPDYLHRTFHLSILALALPVALIYSLSSAGSLFGGWFPAWLSRHHGEIRNKRRPVMAVAALSVSLALLIPFTEHLWLAAILFGLVLAAHQVFSVNLFGLITDVMPENCVGRVTGIGAFWGNAAGMVIVQTVGWHLSSGGAYGAVFLATALAYAAAPLVLELFLHRLTPLTAAGTSAAPPAIPHRIPGE